MRTDRHISSRVLAALAVLGAMAGAGCGSGSMDWEEPSDDAGGLSPDAWVGGGADATSGPDGGEGAPDASPGEADSGALAPDATLDGPDAGDARPDAAAADAAAPDAASAPDAAAAPDAAVPPDAGAPELADCATALLRSSGPVFYYCDCQSGAEPACVAGDDANAGTSPSSPRRTLADARSRFNGMPAGGTVALCRGGSWNEAFGVIHNDNCRAANDSTYCDLRDYLPSWGAPSSARPRLNPSGTAITMWDSERPHEGVRFWNLDIEFPASARTGSAKGFMILEDQNHIDICNVTVNNASIGIQTQQRADYFTVRSSTFTMNGTFAILAGASYQTFDSNTFINNGDVAVVAAAGQAHTIYLACNDGSIPCNGIRVTNNYVRIDPDDTNGYGGCRGMNLIFRGYQNGTVIENNYVEGYAPYGCGAISTSGSAAPSEFHDIVFRRNRVKWGTQTDTRGNLGAPLLMQVDACQNCVVTDNAITSARQARAIMSPDFAHQDAGNFAVTTGTVVRNNSIYMLAGGLGIRVGKYAEGQDFIVENNAVWMPPGQACLGMQRPAAAGHEFTVTDYPSTAANTAGNYCMNTGASPSVLWADPDHGDFRPTAGGPLIGAANQTFYSPVAIGTVEWTPTDPGRPRAPPIDVGAMIH